MKLLALCSCLLACSGSPDTGPETDATTDAAKDATPDTSVGDAAVDADAASTMDASEDSGSLHDAGSECPPCMKDDLCCMVKSSMNYGKCYSGACLACCQ